MQNIPKQLDEIKTELQAIRSMIFELKQDLLGSGHKSDDGGRRYSWCERPEFERPSEERQGTMTTGEKVWLVLQKHVSFPKGVVIELEDGENDDFFMLNVYLPDDSELWESDVLFTIPIKTEKIKGADVSEAAFCLDVIAQVKDGLAVTFIDYDRAEKMLDDWTTHDALFCNDYSDFQTGFMTADKLTDLSKVREHITFLHKYTEFFDTHAKENFLLIATMQIPELRVAVMVTFVRSIFNHLITKNFIEFNRHAASVGTSMIPTLAMKGGRTGTSGYLEMTFAKTDKLGLFA